MFVLCESQEDNMFAHLDPYKGRNSKNVNITTLDQDFPTTTKSVLNDVEKDGLKKSQGGYWAVVMDNQYTSLNSLVTLLEHYHIGSNGTVQSNRIGLDKDCMTLSKRKRKEPQERTTTMLQKFFKYNSTIARLLRLFQQHG